MNRKPNVILCTCDQLRAFEVGCYGNPVIGTPWLDRLAAEGTRFETAVTQYPVCMAARSVLLSGQYNRTCTGGVANVCYATPDGEALFPQYPVPGRPHLKSPTLAELLRENGYHTATIGKWHIHSWPHEVGFDSYLIPRVNHCHVGQSFTENGGIEFVPDGYSVDYEAGRVEEFLADRAGNDQPFFLFFNISPPHCPFSDAPEKYLKMYDPDTIPIRPNVDLNKRIDNQDHWFRVYRWDFRYYNHHLPETMAIPEGWGLRQLIAEYYGLTTWVDDTVGRMLTALDKAGLAEDTIVVFTSDHGDNLGSHGLVQKGGPNEESIRVPLIVRWPAKEGMADRVETEHVAGLIDVAPTLLSLCGVDVPGHFHGHNLTPLLTGGDARIDTHAFIEMWKGLAVRTPGHMYYLPFSGNGRALAKQPEQFYDLAADPYELRNLAGTGESADVARELDKLLRAWDAATPWMPPRK